MGRHVKSLVNENQSAGQFSVIWNATNDLNQSVSAGMYIYVIQLSALRHAKKMLLIK